MSSLSNTELRTTEDGSHTLFNRDAGEHYHSIHGAIQESMHVFIAAGFREIASGAGELSILDVGFGTGLNCLLSLAEAEKLHRSVIYTAIETYTLSHQLAESLNYCSFDSLKALEKAFSLMHRDHEGEVRIGSDFLLRRRHLTLEDSVFRSDSFNLVYFDAFSPEIQPDLWKPDIFLRIEKVMQPGGILVTYCAKGIVRRALQQAGFSTERLPGPPGKREMLRATAGRNL